MQKTQVFVSINLTEFDVIDSLKTIVTSRVTDGNRMTKSRVLKTFYFAPRVEITTKSIMSTDSHRLGGCVGQHVAVVANNNNSLPHVKIAFMHFTFHYTSGEPLHCRGCGLVCSRIAKCCGGPVCESCFDGWVEYSQTSVVVACPICQTTVQ